MSIICIGDFGKTCKGQTEVANLIKTLSREHDIKLILGLGDNIYPSGVKDARDPQFQEKFEIPYSKLPKGLKFYNVLGNHDHRGNTQAQIEYSKRSNRWKMYDYWYHFTKTIGETRVGFYAMDTNLDELPFKMRDRQQREIINSLNSSKTDWNIVYGHHPYRSTGQHGDSYGELKALYDNVIATGKVHFILSGHDHDQQLFSVEEGTPTLIVSGTGSETREVPQIFRLTGDLEFHSETLGICLIEFTREATVVKFYDLSNSVKYSKVINKL